MSDTDNKTDTAGTTATTSAPAPSKAARTPVQAPEPQPEVFLLEDAIRAANADVENAAPVGSSTAEAIAGHYGDQYVGIGGTYTFDKDGNRVPVYERYTDENGNEQTRPLR